MATALRLLTMADVPAAMALVRQSGWNQTAADWQRFLRAQPDGCFAASIGDELVGTVTTIVYDRRLAWIGMMLVDAGHQGQGIGHRLLACAGDFLDRLGVSCAKLDATPEGQRLYENHGFVVEHAVERWALSRPASTPRGPDVPPPAPFPRMEDLFALDRELFGADRRGLLQSLADDSPDLVFVRSSAAQVTGYGFGRRGTRADHLGPWMAHDEKTADSVLTSFLNQSDRPLSFVDCLPSSPWATRLVEARGFSLSRSLTRMYRGSNVVQDPEHLFGAIVGFEFG
jgi:GNAT superfamily N-acetyltransferase